MSIQHKVCIININKSNLAPNIVFPIIIHRSFKAFIFKNCPSLLRCNTYIITLVLCRRINFELKYFLLKICYRKLKYKKIANNKEVCIVISLENFLYWISVTFQNVDTYFYHWMICVESLPVVHCQSEQHFLKDEMKNFRV